MFGGIIEGVMYNIKVHRIGEHFTVGTRVGYIKDYKTLCFSFNHISTDLSISPFRFIDITRHIFIDH